MKIVFQGDSITDVWRTSYAAPYGEGYARLLRDLFEEDIEIVNRGISGNLTSEMVKRWKPDCLDLKPDVLSILGGINDCLWSFDPNGFVTTTEETKQNIRYMIDSAIKASNAKIILMEPFLFDHETERPDLDKKIAAIKEVAAEYHLEPIPLDEIFHAYAKTYDAEELSEDGIHPTLLGHKIIANCWLDAFEKITERRYKRFEV